MNYLKEKLEEKNISQSELARRTEISQSYISKICNGKIDFKKVSEDKLYDLAIGLGIPVDEFIVNTVLRKEILE